MPARTYWKGYLKLSLVTCPVAMSPATSESEKVRFHTLNRETGNRVVSRYVDAETGKPVDADDQAKGYEAEAGRLVVIEDEELEAVRLDTVRTIDIEVRDAKNYFADIDKAKPEPELLDLAQRFIEAKTKDWSPEMVKDPVQEHLLKLIASKKRKGARKTATGAADKGRPGNVVNLFEALKKSLQADRSLQS
jgi:non-homologous end joining protein Ku